jgi:hypothetical protein
MPHPHPILFAQKQDGKPEEVSPAEGAWLMAGSLLELLEIGGSRRGKRRSR